MEEAIGRVAVMVKKLVYSFSQMMMDEMLMAALYSARRHTNTPPLLMFPC